MALINCPECNKEVSDQSSKCPHCGYTIKGMSYDDKKRVGKIILWIIGIIVAIVLCVIIYDASTVSYDELNERIEKSRQKYNAAQDRINELEEEQAKVQWWIDYYENN